MTSTHALTKVTTLNENDVIRLALDPDNSQVAETERGIKASTVREFTRTFYETTDAEDDISVVPDDNTFELFNVRRYGARGDDSKNNTTAIANAVNSAESAGGGVVYVPADNGVYLAENVKMKSGVILMGDGFGSKLQQITNTATDFITLSDAEQVACGVRNIFLTGGNHNNQTTANAAIKFDNTGGTTFIKGDHLHSIVGTVITLFRGNFIEIVISRECWIDRVYGNDGLLNGVLMKGTDCVVSNTTMGKMGNACFRHSGTNIRYIGNKGFNAGVNGSGIQDVWYLDQDRATIVGCEAQDGRRDGLRANAVKHITINGFISDSNDADGFHIVGASSGIVGTGLQAFTRAGSPPFTQDRGLEIDSGATDCRFSGHFEGGTEAVTNNGANCEVQNTVVNQEIVTTTNVIGAGENGKTFYLNNADGFTSNLPSPAQGLKFKFVVKTPPTTAYIVVTDSGSNILYGTINEITTTTGVSIQAQDTLNFVASVSLAGDWVKFESDDDNWYVNGITQVDDGITVSVT